MVISLKGRLYKREFTNGGRRIVRKMRTYSGAVIHRRGTHGWKEVLQLGPRRGRELEVLQRNLRVDLSNWTWTRSSYLPQPPFCALP